MGQDPDVGDGATTSVGDRTEVVAGVRVQPTSPPLEIAAEAAPPLPAPTASKTTVGLERAPSGPSATSSIQGMPRSLEYRTISLLLGRGVRHEERVGAQRARGGTSCRSGGPVLGWSSISPASSRRSWRFSQRTNRRSTSEARSRRFYRAPSCSHPRWPSASARTPSRSAAATAARRVSQSSASTATCAWRSSTRAPATSSACSSAVTSLGLRSEHGEGRAGSVNIETDVSLHGCSPFAVCQSGNSIVARPGRGASSRVDGREAARGPSQRTKSTRSASRMTAGPDPVSPP